MTMTFDPEQVEPAGAAEERSKLQQHFGRVDIFFFLVCTLVGIDGLGTLATVGGEGFSWLLICLLLFAVPSSMLLAELGAAYPAEGGPYVWVRMAFGHLAGAVNNFFYWVTNPVWMGGTLVGTALGGLVVFYNGGEDFSTPFTYVFAGVFIWAGTLFAILSFRVGKWVATIGALARFLLLGVFSVLVVAYGAENGFDGPSLAEYGPSFSGFVALVPLVLFSLVGFELPSAAGEEMTDAAKDVPAGIRKSVVATGLLYGIPLLGILLVLPTDQASGLSGFPEAIRQSLTVFGGEVTTAPDGTVTATLSGFGTGVGYLLGALVALVAFTSGLTWIMGSDRTLAVSCYDGAGPRYLGAFSARFGTPLRVNVLSGVLASVVFVAATEITDGDLGKFFGVVLALAISTTLISYLGIFPAAWKLRRADPDRPRPYRAPALGLLTVVSSAWIAFATVQLLFPGLGDEWFGEDYRLDGWAQDEKWLYLLTELVPLAVFVGIATAFWTAGRRHVARSRPVEPAERSTT
ncbi:amino acid permease [Modestobacter sp. I12A-02628]|uniref:APC family permease n=1 Tax=Goekera deserti TaxID=2497753 RepID=A0A7K3WJ95_9ACTN|nr:APC family permease [Goekera deserti]MPR00539.1 amino acid permease [Goekera deserti]NDI50475.1 amino acid permease [Goekera deserti]NEL56571.1 APC family permease [Goekera deserti]